MNKLKRIIIFTLCTLMLVSFVACSGQNPDNTNNSVTNPQSNSDDKNTTQQQDSLGEDLKDKSENITDDIRDGVDNMKEDIKDMTGSDGNMNSDNTNQNK